MIEGTIECLDRYGVSGWACNSAALDRPVQISIHIGDRLLGCIEANEFRADLTAAGKGNGKHCFRQPFLAEVNEYQLCQIVVRAEGTVLRLKSPLGAFFDGSQGNIAPSSALENISRNTFVFPVNLRRIFEMTCNSALAKIMRLTYPEFLPTKDRINALHRQIYEIVTTGNYERLHADILSVRIGKEIRKVPISRVNTQFLGLDREIEEFRYGYEPEILALVDLLVPNNGVLLDVGANWGVFSIFLAVRKGFSGKVFAFEPGSGSFHDLTELVTALNLAERILCHKVALADYSGVATLSTPLFSGLSSIGACGADTHEDIWVARLDDLHLPKANLLKIDVEGFDSRVLRGGEQYIPAADSRRSFLRIGSSLVTGIRRLSHLMF